MAQVLLTGFEPWHTFEVNSSWEAVSILDNRQVAGFRIAARRLPVAFARVGPALAAVLEEVEPDICIGFGMGPRDTHVRLERVAVNLCDAVDYPDNDGTALRDTPVVPDGPAAYWTGLPVRRIEAALRNHDFPVVTSLSAGAFLCNNLFYRLMDTIANERPGMIGGFVHVPPSDASGAAGLPLTRLQRAAAIVVETTVKEIGNIHLGDALS